MLSLSQHRHKQIRCTDISVSIFFKELFFGISNPCTATNHMYLEHVRLPQLHCRSKVLTPILLSNLSLSKEHFAVSQQSTTLLTAQYIYTRSLGNKRVQSKVFYRWPLKSCWRINAISPLHFQFFKVFEAQFEFYLVAKVQNANSIRITKNKGCMNKKNSKKGSFITWA